MPPENILTSDSDLEFSKSQIEITAKRRRSSTGPKYSCRIGDCKESFVRLDQLDRHEYHHTGIKKYKCEYDDCYCTYSTISHLKRHLRATHERQEKPKKTVSCELDDCKKMFINEENMQKHMREMHENPRIYHCSHCQEKFTHRGKMHRHVIKQHTHEHPFHCEKCKKGMLSKWALDRHEKICKIYPCPDCELVFDKWTLYTKHCKALQHGRRNYKCDHCDQVYGRPSELLHHVALKHWDDEQKIIYKCTEPGCNRIYSYYRNLQQHKLIVHRGKRFKCSHSSCGKLFVSWQLLQMHKERVHSTVAAKPKPEEVVLPKPRRQRKDAGQPQKSMLALLSGVQVPLQLDKMLRVRHPEALQQVSEILKQQEQTKRSKTERNTTKKQTKKSKVNEQEEEINVKVEKSAEKEGEVAQQAKELE